MALKNYQYFVKAKERKRKENVIDEELLVNFVIFRRVLFVIHDDSLIFRSDRHANNN